MKKDIEKPDVSKKVVPKKNVKTKIKDNLKTDPSIKELGDIENKLKKNCDLKVSIYGFEEDIIG